MCALYKGSEIVAGLSKNTIVNGFHLFDFKWSDKRLNDISWLESSTFSWQSGDVYVTAYNKLVEEYNNGVEDQEEFMAEGLYPSITFRRSPNGYKIVNVSNFNDATEDLIQDKYNADGIAWYYIIDTVNKRFKLPRTKFGFEGLRDTVGNDIDESLPNIKGDVSSTYYITDSNTTSGVFESIPGNGQYGTSNSTVGHGFTFNASRSSSTYQDGAPVQERGTQMYLYFYVGEYAREAIEQTAGLNTELFNNKVDKSSIYYDVDTKTLVIG